MFPVLAELADYKFEIISDATLLIGIVLMLKFHRRLADMIVGR